MMNHRFAAAIGWALILHVALLLAGSSSVAARDTSAPVFGLGGSFVGVLSIDDGPGSLQLDDAVFPALPDRWMLSGGSCRGGVVGGWSLGCVGWGASATMTSADGLASLEAGAGFGGLDVGAVFAGDERSFVTAGAVFGGGAAGLMVRVGDGTEEILPGGILLGMEPTVRTSTSAFLSVAPYLSFQVQPIRALGFELRFGTMIELASIHWHDEPSPWSLPELRLDGPWITLGASWGWLGRGGVASQVVERVEPLAVPISNGAILVDNAIGDIVIRFQAAPDARQMELPGMILGSATVRAPAEMADTIGIDVFAEEDLVGVRSETPERAGGWRVDYDLLVPTGTPLQIDLGIGNVRIVGLDGRCQVRLGVGDVDIETAAGESLLVSVGVGSVTIGDLRADETSLAVETGSVDVRVAGDASLDMMATTGLGDIDILDFPQAVTAVQGTLGHDLRATLHGRPTERQLIIRVGVGKILIGEADGDDSIDPNGRAVNRDF